MMTSEELIETVTLQLEKYEDLTIVQMKRLEENLTALLTTVHDDRTLLIYDAAHAYAKQFEGGGKIVIHKR